MKSRYRNYGNSFSNNSKRDDLLVDKFFLIFWLIFIIIFVTLIILPFFTDYNIFVAFKLFGETVNLLLIYYVSIIGITIKYIFNSLKKVEADQIGCVLLFGKPLFQVGSGLNFVPFGFYELKKETGLVIQEQFPENNATNPIRITHGFPDSQSDNPLDTQITTSVTIVVSYKIVNFVKFIQIIGSIEELKKQMGHAVISTTRNEFAKKRMP